MFADSLWLNLLLFLGGQIAGWSILRSGLVATGIAVLGILWIAADLALVLRFLLDDQGAGYIASVWVTQLTAIGSAVAYFGLRMRVRSETFRAAERTELAAIERSILRGDRDEAFGRLRRFVRRDPWHLAARILLASEFRRRGRPAAARRLLVGARRIDSGSFRDLIEFEVERLAGKHRSSVPGNTPEKDRPRTASSTGSVSAKRSVERSAAATDGAGGLGAGTESGADSGVQSESRAKA